jgi:hypothetical protein
MKNLIIVAMVLIGMYWLVGHSDPFPLNHESFGLYEHSVHRIVGVVLLGVALCMIWKWRFRG